jgi:endoglucanase
MNMRKVIYIILFIFVSHTLATETWYDSLSFTSSSGKLWANGQRFHLKGASWFGFETSARVPHGLWSKDYKFLLDFLANNGFNTIRIPYFLELALNNGSPTSINYSNGLNADLAGLSSLEVMDKIIQAAAARGLLVVLDLHSFQPDSFMQNNMWYDASHPESMVINGWVSILSRYKNQWNVIGADLKNEPYACTWNSGNANTDWNTAAQRIAEAIHAQVSTRFLILVEGVGATYPPCQPANCFWGENLIGVSQAPITITQQNKVVYSPHVYGPAVAPQTYFNDPNFPSNMPQIWDSHFGFIANRTGHAQVIGEWGGVVLGANGAWMNAFANYLISKDTRDNFFWCLNPDSGDTGGLLADDWTTPVTDKLALLARLQPSPTKFKFANNKYCIENA